MAFLDKHLPNRKSEKDKFGEVFTPASLVNSVYDQIAKYSPSIWENPETTLLDPSAGVGNFTALAYFRFMEGLKPKIPNVQKRSQHIIENMVFMVELNPENCRILRRLFGPKANIICASFLDESHQQVNTAVVKRFLPTRAGFSMVVGNPPYQQERPETKGTNAGRKTLWDRFVVASFDILAPDGYLGFITPAGWRGTGRASYLWKLLTQKQILYLRIYSQQDGQRLFNATTRFDVYVVRNSPNTQLTHVVDQKGEEHRLQLGEWPFLPNYMLPFFHSVIVPVDKGIRVLYGTHHHTQKKNMRSTPSPDHSHKVVHNVNQHGLGYWYAKDAHSGHFRVPKVILNFNQKQYNFPEQNDFKGNLGMSQLSFGIPIQSKEEGERVLRAVGTPLFQELIKASKWGAFQTDYRMFSHFAPKIWDIINRSAKPAKPAKTVSHSTRRRPTGKGLRKREGTRKAQRR
jgi:hypothetical protein